MTLQAEGSYEKAKALIEKLGVVRPQVQKLLDRLTGVPVDIEPRFTTAATLAKSLTAAAARLSSATSGPIADHAVDAPAEQPPHVLAPRSPSRPSPADPARCACAMKRGVTMRRAPERLGHLELAIRRPAERPPRPTIDRAPSASPRAPRRSRMRRLVLARRAQHAPSEGAKRNAIDGAGRADLVDRPSRQLRLVAFQLDDQRAPG